MSRWYPIQDAPTNGDLLILCEGDDVLTGYWNDATFVKSWVVCDPSVDGVGNIFAFNPTHWMPLPEPPSI